jgi:type II secretory pathway pseudopilin PulG
MLFSEKSLSLVICRQQSPIRSPGFSLLEVILSAVMLVIMTLSTYKLFQVNVSTSRLSNDLDAADRELFANMQEIRRLGASFNWCSGAGSVEPTNCGTDSSGNALYRPLTQAYYAKNLPTIGSNFANACQDDVGNYDTTNKRYDLAQDSLLEELKKEIENVSNFKEVHLDEKATRRLLVKLEKEVRTEAFGTRKVTRYLYLVPEVAKWCPS